MRGKLTVIIICFIGVIFSQDDKEMVVENTLEWVSYHMEFSESALEELSQQLHYYIKHPINLNHATRDELLQFYLLSAEQVEALIQHRSELGVLMDYRELQSIPAFSITQIRVLRPFVYAGATNPYKWDKDNLKLHGKHIAILRLDRPLQSALGYSRYNGYTGPRYRTGLRYLYRYRNYLSAGIQFENDPGEPFKLGKKYYLTDHTSFHVALGDLGVLQKLIVGDYQVKFGQGLTLWNGLGFGKSSFTTLTLKTPSGIRPHTSFSELDFMRGTALKLGQEKWNFTCFGSHRFLNGNLFNDTLYSFSTNTYHRTEYDQSRRGNVQELTFGANSQLNLKHFSLGLSYVNLNYNIPINQIRQLHQQEKWDRHNERVGLDYRVQLKRIQLAGELALSNYAHWASTTHLSGNINNALSFSLVHRYYSQHYFTRYTHAFGFSAAPVNEQGVYLGLSYKPAHRWLINFYLDGAEHLWLKYQKDRPSIQTDALLMVQYRVKRKWDIAFRLKYRHWQENDDGQVVNTLYPVNKLQGRLHLNVFVNKEVAFRSRIEVGALQEGSWEFGYLFYQDLIYKPKSSIVSGNFRWSIFNIADFDLRVYAYENDMLFVYQQPFYYQQGMRFYLNLRLQPLSWLDFWMKFGTTKYFNQTEVGSGNALTRGPVRSEVKMQLVFKL